MGGKKRKNFPTVEDELSKPWCYYCERDFTDMLNLIRHQKAKHFKCDRCGRRLNTAGGLSVHMNQVHKEQLHFVENSLENRKGLDVEIFGMEGIPDDIKQTHQQRVLQNFYQAEAERRKNTGNPPPGQGGPQKESRRRPTVEELKQRLTEHRVTKVDMPAGLAHSAPSTDNSTIAPNQFAYSQPNGQPPFAQANYSVSAGQYATLTPTASSTSHAAHAQSLSANPSIHDTRGSPISGLAGSVDELIADVTRNVSASKSAKETADLQANENATSEKKSKKDTKAIKLIYSDNSMSPEEKRASLPRYMFSRG